MCDDENHDICNDYAQDVNNLCLYIALTWLYYIDTVQCVDNFLAKYDIGLLQKH